MPFIIDPKTKQRVQLDQFGQVSTPAQTNQAPSAVSQPAQTVKPQPAGFVGGFLKSLFQSTIDRGRDVIGGVYSANMAIPEIVQRVTVDPQNKSKTFDREVQRGLQFASEKGREAMLSSAEEDPLAIKPITHGVKTGLEASQYLVPAGKSVKAITAGGAVSGTMSALAKDDVNAQDVLLSTAGGAGGSLLLGKALPGVINVTRKGTGKVLKGTVGKVASHVKDSAEQSIVKATPTAWMNALTEHGIDVNAVGVKYFKGARNYDDVLGTIAERGNGGSLQKALSTAEAKLQKAVSSYGSTARVSLDDFAKDITAQMKDLKKVAGNEETVDKLSKLLKEQLKIYKKGATAKQLLDMKRIADSKFGKAVVDEETGSVSAQFQKVLANYSRQKLHSLFPEIGDALETQTEILTIKPLLNKARSIDKTNGSTIRTGRFSNINPLNPTTYGNLLDWWVSNPANAVTAMENANRIEGIANTISGEMPDISVNGNVRETVVRGARKVGAELLSPDVSNETNNQGEGYNTEANPSNEYSGGNLDHTGNIPQPEMESPQTNAFSGMTKQEVLTKAVQEGASKADLMEISEIYDLVTAESKKPEDFLQQEPVLRYTPDQIEVAMENAVLAGDTKALTQLAKLYEIAVARDERLLKLAEANAKSDKPSAGETAVSAVQQLRTLFGRGNAEAVGTDQDLALGGTGSLTERASGKTAGVTKKLTDPAYINDLEIFQNQATNVLGLITQAFGSGTPQDAEAQRLIKSIPGAGTPDTVAKAWFTNLEDLLKRTNVQAPSIEDTSQLIEK